MIVVAAVVERLDSLKVYKQLFVEEFEDLVAADDDDGVDVVVVVIGDDIADDIESLESKKRTLAVAVADIE